MIRYCHVDCHRILHRLETWPPPGWKRSSLGVISVVVLLASTTEAHTVTAADVVDQPSLRAFVQQAAEFSASQVSDADDAYTFFDQTFRSFGDWRHGSVYLFVIKPDGFNVFHASRKEFEGTHQLQVEDKNGTKVVQELIRAARGGGGFVEYFFDNPGIIGDEESGSLKVGYAARVSIGEGFILVAGYYPANSQERVEAQEEANRNFLGLRFGVALGMTATISGDDRVEEAELVENIVRVKSTTNHRPRVLLETHYFWQWKADDATVNVAGRPVTIRQADIGVGPFVAIQTSGEDILEAFGMNGHSKFPHLRSSKIPPPRFENDDDRSACGGCGQAVCGLSKAVWARLRVHIAGSVHRPPSLTLPLWSA